MVATHTLPMVFLQLDFPVSVSMTDGALITQGKKVSAVIAWVSPFITQLNTVITEHYFSYNPRLLRVIKKQ